jgi:N6-L-threonylcarbamoyladenine synthase
LILSIESSCDDSSIALTEISSKKLIFHKKISQEKEHDKYGGVVPELASRLHLQALPNILEETKPYFKELKAISVTNAPGLSVTLNEGIMMAKALAISLDLPLIGVNHLIGHIYSTFIDKEAIFPMMILLVSGGHTKVLNMNSFDDIVELASTMDDSFGESFDKVSKMLKEGYPGGPIIEKLALNAKEDIVPLPVPLIQSPRMEFSYSGLKNAVRLAIEEEKYTKEEIALSFQNRAIEHLIHKTKKLIKNHKPKHFSIVGGASANLSLRNEFENLSQKFNFTLHYPEMKYCSDNAAMIGRVAVEMYEREEFTNYNDLKAVPRVEFKK